MASSIGAGVSRQATVRPVLLRADQPGVGEHIEMLHDRRQRHRKRLRELADRDAFLSLDLREQRPPRRIGERRKRAVERAS